MYPGTARILVVDDEPPIIDLLTYNLQKANFEVIVARDGQEALDMARQKKPDLIILDLMLPLLDGLDVCRTLRRENDVPIIMLTARDSEVDRVVGLELGADDYVVKPFSVRELMARVRSVLRRTAAPPSGSPADVLAAGGLRIDVTSHEASLDGVPLELTALEFKLLSILVGHAGQVLSREQLLEQVWDTCYLGDQRVVDAAVKRLRAQLRTASPQSDPIATVRGVGYKVAAS